jgi:hypothetical protein
MNELVKKYDVKFLTGDYIKWTNLK